MHFKNSFFSQFLNMQESPGLFQSYPKSLQKILEYSHLTQTYKHNLPGRMDCVTDGNDIACPSNIQVGTSKGN